VRSWARSIPGEFFAVAVGLLAAVGTMRPAWAEATAAPCTPTHEVRDDGATLALQTSCPLSLAESSQALEELLRVAYPNRRMTRDRAMLEIGRILDYPWLSQQLAEAATRSPVWNAAHGRGRRSDKEGAVASMVDTRRLLAGWAPVFARFHIRARADSVADVRVGEVGKAPELAPLAGDPAHAGKKLPFDGRLRVRLEPLPEAF